MKNVTEVDVEIYMKMEQSILYFIAQVWGFVPQKVKEEYQTQFKLGLLLKGDAWKTFCEQVQPFWFEPYQEGLNMTWQQALVCHGIDKALKGEVPLRISIVSGHGIGKSMMLSLIILWFLFVHPDSQVACTSPGSEQLYDVLWKELKKWIEKMPEGMADMYIWESTHIRMKEAPQVWFARAKTASKENTEALAGVHADWVLIAVDEASGVGEPIFETMEGALTSGNILVFIISNGTRSIGYFYDTHHKDKDMWQNYAFSSLDSPRVDQKYVDSIISKYGSDSVQYAIRVEGRFPDEGIMDDKGYVQLFNEKDLHFVDPDHNWKPIGRPIGALDASGEGQDKSEWAVRDRQRAAIVAEEDTSNAAGMAIKSLTVCSKYDINPSDFVIDNFGEGANVAMEIALATQNTKGGAWRVTPMNVGDPCENDDDKLQFVNQRAEMYWKMLRWCRAGGEIMDTPRLKDQLLSIRFKRTTTGRIQMMSKVEMKKIGFPSPDKADAIAMTFLRNDSQRAYVASNANQNANAFDAFLTCD